MAAHAVTIMPMSEDAAQENATNNATPPDGQQQESGSNNDTDQTQQDSELSRYVLVLFQSGNPKNHYGTLSRSVFERIRNLLRTKVTSSFEQSELDIWLESVGGSASIAYKIWLELRSKFRRIRVVIPDYAKSAATLLSVGADEIIMATAAELGPLDVQIEHPDRENVIISGIDESRALGFLSDFAVGYIVNGGKVVFEATELPRRDVLREFSSFAAHFLQPLIAKIDPQLWHRAAQDLDLVMHYGMAMLEGRQLTEQQQLRQLEPWFLLHHLVAHYPSHECLISRQEALESLHLPVTFAENYNNLGPLSVLHNGFQAGEMMDDGTDHHIEVYTEPELADIISNEDQPHGEDNE